MGDDLVGKRLGHFRIVAKLGQGGMGEVYEAKDEKLRRTVALKVLREDLLENGALLRRFVREGRSAAAITHPNIAMVHEVGESEGRVYIAMELVEGTTLRRVLGTRTITVAEAVHIAKAVARGLSKAHERGIVHRDLKPDNIMLGEEGEVKVLDFGVAKSFRAIERGPDDAPPESETLTGVGHLVGTPAYMPPEQALGGEVDGRADIYALGVTLHEMITGSRPTRVSPEAVTMPADDAATPAVPSAAVPMGFGPAPQITDPDLRRIVERCREADPVLRYSSVRDLLADLERFQSANAIDSKPETPASRGKRAEPVITPQYSERSGTLVSGRSVPAAQRSRRWKLFAGMSAAVLAALAGAFAVARVTAGDTKRAPPEASTTRAATQPSAAPSASLVWGLPPPKTSDAAAQNAYRDGLQAFHDGNFEKFDALIREATKADPVFPAGALRLAFAKWHSVRGAVTDARADLARASRRKDDLSEHDRTLLEVLEPVIAREPPDSDATEKRLEEAVRRSPSDPEFLYLLANEQRRYDLAKSLQTFDRVLEADPNFVTALRQKAQTLEMQGDAPKARALLDECVARFPNATGCLNERAWLNEDEGSCAAVVTDAKEMSAIDPDSYRAYEALAQAYVQGDKPTASIKEVLGLEWKLAPKEVATRQAPMANASLAALSGDFAAARSIAGTYEAELQSSDARVHAAASSFLVELAVETGDLRTAGVLARLFCDRELAWSGAPDVVTGRLLRVERLAGVLKDDEYARARSAFVDGFVKASTRARFPKAAAWVAAYGAAVETHDDAVAAEAARASAGFVPVGQRTAWTDYARANVLYLLSRASEALPYVTRAARMCSALDEPFLHVRAELLLGRTLEAAGEKQGACGAYAEVLKHWGEAKPKSVTADAARERSRALGCR